MSSLPDSVFEKALAAKASDVHIVAGAPLLFRIDGVLTPQTQTDVSPKEVEAFVKDLLGAPAFERFQKEKEIDMAHGLPNGVRLRVNCHFERGNMAIAARIIPTEIPSLADVDLTDIATQVVGLREGLILFTGPTGSGKSTSLAALLQSINDSRAENIITLEDPIEFLFPKGKGVIRQRQYMEDFLSFPEAMKRILRQDPNIIMVGEMRDPETIAAALTLAETGHLVLATLHTPNVMQTIDRIVDVFPPHQQPQVRSQLALSLKAIIAQKLLPKEGGGRVALREVLINTPAAQNIIRDNRVQELASVLQTGKELGMRSFEADLKDLKKKGLINEETLELMMGNV